MTKYSVAPAMIAAITPSTSRLVTFLGRFAITGAPRQECGVLFAKHCWWGGSTAGPRSTWALRARALRKRAGDAEVADVVVEPAAVADGVREHPVERAEQRQPTVERLLV